jgi:hypothetical protein
VSRVTGVCGLAQYRDMLDFLVALGETRDAGVAQDVTARARAAVEKVRVCCFVGCGWDHCWGGVAPMIGRLARR